MKLSNFKEMLKEYEVRPIESEDFLPLLVFFNLSTPPPGLRPTGHHKATLKIINYYKSNRSPKIIAPLVKDQTAA